MPVARVLVFKAIHKKLIHRMHKVFLEETYMQEYLSFILYPLETQSGLLILINLF